MRFLFVLAILLLGCGQKRPYFEDRVHALEAQISELDEANDTNAELIEQLQQTQETFIQQLNMLRNTLDLHVEGDSSAVEDWISWRDGVNAQLKEIETELQNIDKKCKRGKKD